MSDLVPPLRWSDAATIPLLRDQPELPDAWWRSLPMARVLAVLSPERLAGILSGVALEHWPAAAVGDILPALYALDPEEADEPCTAIALDRTGSWSGLLALTGHELRDQPFIQPLPVLNALFAAVFSRMAQPVSGVASRSGAVVVPSGAEGAPSETAAPDAAAPETATPEGAVPETALPESVVAEGGVPEGAVQETALPESVVAGGGVPEGAVQGSAAPEVAAGSGGGPSAPDGPPAPDTSDARPAASPRRAGKAPPDAGGEERRPGGLHALLDGAFADLDDKSWAVAQNRVFSDVPATVEALAKLFGVRPEVIDEAEASLRRRLGEWLASDEAAPYRDHLAEVRNALGKAAPKSRLVTAASWHVRELHSLDVPAWQFVLATLSGYHLVDEWLVDGDIAELRHHTRDVISGAKPPLTMTKALKLVTSLGIHPEVSKEWLENVPQLRILGAGQQAPQRAGGGKGVDKGNGNGRGNPPGPAGKTVGAAGGEPGREPAVAPFRPLKDVSLTRRCFRQPDGRWWLRIDITTEHIQGTECALPTGFASYLGMSPGTASRVQSAVGEIALSWRERPVLESLRTLLEDVGAKQGSHLFLTLSDEGVLRARHLPTAGEEVEPIARALRLVGYTAPGGTQEQAGRVIATRVGMTGPVSLPDLLGRLRERGDRDLLSLMA
ncbi:hypothetical protein [Streptosporangium sp. NPDC006007]|uniref:hypothetical protein n=1 Tax=Streptosporangium sp. NPDC006007 TaxID=3154575 RepID=UPI0033B466AF